VKKFLINCFVAMSMIVSAPLVLAQEQDNKCIDIEKVEGQKLKLGDTEKKAMEAFMGSPPPQAKGADYDLYVGKDDTGAVGVLIITQGGCMIALLGPAPLEVIKQVITPAASKGDGI